MFVSPGPAGAADAPSSTWSTRSPPTLCLALRVGIAYGPAASYAGDWFGSPVNVASRVTVAAPPWTVYAEQSARAAIGDQAGFTWQDVGPRHLKGISGQVRLFQASRSVRDR